MKLRPQQKALVEWLESRWYEDYANVIWKMRSGKTLAICTFLSEHVGENLAVLVVCPPAVVEVWEKHWAITKREYSPTITIMSTGKLKDYAEHNRTEYDVVVVDELHQFRYHSARYQALQKLSKESVFRIGLTGTPVDSHLSEMYYPLTWLSKGMFFGEYITKAVFQSTYCYAVSPHLGTKSKFEIRDDIREEFMKAIYDVSSVWEDEKVIPPDHEQVVYPVTPKQRRLASLLSDGKFKVFYDEYGIEFAGMEVAHRRDKTRQLFGGFLISDLRVTVPDVCVSWKWWHMAKLISKIGATRLVVWYRYVYESTLAKETIERVFGVRVEMFTQANLTKFNGDKIDVLLCHPLSAGAGIDISHAEKTIFLSPTPNYTALTQAFYRLADRVGNKKKAYHLIADHSVDKSGYDKIWEKDSVTNEIYGGHHGEV